MTTDYDSLMVDLADAESLLGMLQRGRGKGYLLALQTPPEKVWPLLFECITNDPRVDSQCEYRGEYYAGLIRATYMDLEPLRSHLKAAEDGDGDTALVIDTLVILAREWQDNHALDILEDYVSGSCQAE